MISIYVPDALRKTVEGSSNNKLTVLYDDYGQPSFMRVYYPTTWSQAFFYGYDSTGGYVDGVTQGYKDTSGSLSNYVKLNRLHRAFLKDSTTYYTELFIGLYPSTVINGSAMSLPGKAPSCNKSYWEAQGLSCGKGEGWHMMTNWEYCFLAQSNQGRTNKIGGNNSWGKNILDGRQFAGRVDGYQLSGAQVSTTNPANGTTYTGTGPSEWRIDHAYNDITDLVGNVYEYADGLRLVGGNKIYMDYYNVLNRAVGTDTGLRLIQYDSGGSPDDNSALTIRHTSDSTPGGNYIEPGNTTLFNVGEFQDFDAGVNSSFLTYRNTQMNTGTDPNNGAVLATEALICNVYSADALEQKGTVHFNCAQPLANREKYQKVALRGGSWRSNGDNPYHGFAGTYYLNMLFEVQENPNTISSPYDFRNTVGFRVAKFGSTAATGGSSGYTGY